MTPAVTVRGLLDARPESVGLSIELLAGSGGLQRPITSPYIQKTGLALAGFHEYLQAGRILLFGESEVRFLESLDAQAANAFYADLAGKPVAGARKAVVERSSLPAMENASQSSDRLCRMQDNFLY